jgi:hypothetical protein
MILARTLDRVAGIPVWLAFVGLRWWLGRDLDISGNFNKENSHG